MALKFHDGADDNIHMDGKKDLTRRSNMIQWVGVIIALLGFAWNGIKDYQKGEIKLPVLQENKELTKTNYPVQYCLMAYDPNVDKVFYQHEDGQWHDYPPQQRRYASPQEHDKVQGQKALASGYGTQRESFGHYVR